jgi:DNA mismatch repair protein MutS
MAPSGKLTPMFRQYRSVKENHPDAILLFRMGDFYEMFYDDAKTASRVADLTLTSRGKGTAHEVPMCGFPHHQLDAYTARLVRAGHRVAVCDQTEDPKRSRGLVRREVVRIVTPGTVLDPDQLEARENAWAAAVAVVSRRPGAAFLDASTGEFLAWEPGDEVEPWEALADRLEAFGPREIVHPEDFPWPESLRRKLENGTQLTPVEPYSFRTEGAQALLERHLDVGSLDGYGLRDRPSAVAAAGGLLLYVQENQKSGLEHVDGIAFHEPGRSLLLDPATRRNLEIDRSIRDAGHRATLIDAVDATRTAGGARLLRSWLLAPLVSVDEIGNRHEAVAELLRRHDVRHDTRERLAGVQDIERLVARAVAGASSPRELTALRASLERLPSVVAVLAEIESPGIRNLIDDFDPCDDVAALLARALHDDPPVGVREGGIVRDGYDDELDELRSVRGDGRSYIASLETTEREATGIASLKVRFNKVFGYFIEVSKPNLHLVPDRYHRKQTIANGERFVTPELKEYEAKVLHAQERIESLEYELFCEVRGRVAVAAPRLKAAAQVASILDVFSGLAETAALNDYCRPEVHDGTDLEIVAGRHPVVEQTLLDRRFVPNGAALASDGDAITILTGPNMGGKSTYLRQVALIVLLAQAGSFVPAESARIGVVDRIFCRVGASDSLAEGQSTFMVEMTETANILRHATSRSLVLLDEIGRGTSTFDGLSIAWAVVEHLHGAPEGRPRTLFATHYHELTELSVELPGVTNRRMGAREHGDRVVFTHRVEPGPADRSYGIQVARLAGVPGAVVSRAREILGNLERDAYGRDGLPRLSRSSGRRSGAQPTLFPMMTEETPEPEPADPAAVEVLAELREKDPDRLTPLEALQLVHEWRRRLGDDSS